MATWPTVTNDDGSGTTGTSLDLTLFNAIRDYIGAAWSAVTFAAGNFTAGGAQTWTLASGDQDTFRYVECGKTMTTSVVLVTTSVGGTPNPELRIAIPNGRTAQSTSGGTFSGLNNSVAFVGTWQATSGNAYISLYVDSSFATNWTAATNTTQVRGTFIVHIN